MPLPARALSIALCCACIGCNDDAPGSTAAADAADSTAAADTADADSTADTDATTHAASSDDTSDERRVDSQDANDPDADVHDALGHDTAVHDADVPHNGDATDPQPRTLGDVVSADVVADCGSQLPTGATCWQLAVACPNIPNLTAFVGVLEPSSTASGTIVTHKGGEGTDFNTTVATQAQRAGFRVALIRWESAWELTPDAGLLAAACRPATVTRWVFDALHGADRTRGFCAHGHSGGGGAFAFGLAHYGLGAILDHVAISAGPPFARLDVGCDASLEPVPAPTLCPTETTPVEFALPTANINSWEHTTTCNGASPDPTEAQRWADDSVLSANADLDYPRTVVSFWDCMTNPNGTTGGAWWYSGAITSQLTRTCFTDCNAENLGAAGEADLTRGLTDDCVPRH